MARGFWHIIFTLLLLSGCKNFDEPEQSDPTPKATNISLQTLREAVGERGVLITNDLTIGGYVTTHDKSSNFYKTFYIDDGTGGIEIMAGMYDLNKIYPLGYYITMDLKGCCISKHYETLQVGLEAAAGSSYPTDYFSSHILLDKYISRYAIRRDIAPMPLLSADLRKNFCGRLVSIANLKATTEEYVGQWDVNDLGQWSGYNFFRDDDGNTIAVYTSEYADYADREVPSGKVALCGILQYGKVGGKEFFMIKMRDETDCVPYK